MLAVVFWNTRKPTTEIGRYESSLKAFHAALNANKPEGFRFSTTYRVDAPPWFQSDCEIYEDWYVMSNFAAMDALDHAVINASSKNAHRDLMKQTARASGAMVGLTKGLARTNNLPHAYWLHKPQHVSSDEFVESVEAQLPDGRCSLWTRAMALGPAEHCLLASDPVEISKTCRATVVRRKLVWQP